MELKIETCLITTSLMFDYLSEIGCILFFWCRFLDLLSLLLLLAFPIKSIIMSIMSKNATNPMSNNRDERQGYGYSSSSREKPRDQVHVFEAPTLTTNCR